MKTLALFVLVLFSQFAYGQTYSPPWQIGGSVSIPSNADNNTTQVGIVGSVLFTPINTGPAFGNGICGFAYRNTGETNLDPSLVMRCNAYEFETVVNGSLAWAAVLNSRGLCLGCRPSDTLPYSAAYPQAAFDLRVHNGDEVMRIWSDTDTYVSFDSPDSSKGQCTLFRVAGDAVAAFGRCGQLFGRPLNEINYGKVVSGSWVYVGTLMSW